MNSAKRIVNKKNGVDAKTSLYINRLEEATIEKSMEIVILNKMIEKLAKKAEVSDTELAALKGGIETHITTSELMAEIKKRHDLETAAAEKKEEAPKECSDEEK